MPQNHLMSVQNTLEHSDALVLLFFMNIPVVHMRMYVDSYRFQKSEFNGPLWLIGLCFTNFVKSVGTCDESYRVEIGIKKKRKKFFRKPKMPK